MEANILRQAVMGYVDFQDGVAVIYVDFGRSNFHRERFSIERYDMFSGDALCLQRLCAA